MLGAAGPPSRIDRGSDRETRVVARAVGPARPTADAGSGRRGDRDGRADRQAQAPPLEARGPQGCRHAARDRRPDHTAAHAAHPRDARPARPELLGARTGHPDARRPRRPRGVPVQPDPGLQRCARRPPADPRGPCLLAGPAGWLHHPAPGRHVGRPHRRAHRARVPEPRRHRRPPREDRVRPACTASTTASTSTRRRRSGSRPAGWLSRSSTISSSPDDQAHFFDFANELERLIRLAERQAFGPSTQALIDEAVSRDIPFIRLDRHSLVQFGHGVHQQRIRATMTSKTSAIGVDIASDKSLTNRLLDSAGPARSPAPTSSTTEDEAVAVAKRLGFPCVVKPLDGNHGRGVHLDLRSEEQVRAAFPGALVAEPFGRRRRRDLRRGQRLPLPRDRRQGRRDRGAGAGERDRRRRAHDPPARRHREPGSAPWHRPREGAHADQGRRGSRGAGPEPGLRARRRPARRHVDQARADRQHVDRRYLDRPDDGGPSRQRRDRRDGRADRRARCRRHRLHLPRHHDARPRDRRGDRRGQRGARASGCTPTRPRASRSTSPGP